MDSIAEKQATDKTPPAGNRPDTKAQIAYFEKMGFSFFALRPNDKRPAGGWDMFQHRLPSTTEKSNWIYEQRQNFAIVTGSISGNLVMVDLDPFKMDTDPQEWIQRWPTGYLVRTASNGYHLGFIAPTGVQVSNTTDKLAPGVDTRGEGGYVVAPGAKVAYYGKDAEKKGVISGYIGEYVMIGDGQPAPMPPDLLAMLVTEEPRQERPPQDYSPADADEAQTLAMLAVLPDWFDDYDSWRNICFAVFHGHGINGVSMIEGRWQCKPGEVLKMWESVEAHQEKRKANGQKIITYGSLVHAAKFYGYVPPRPDGNGPTDDDDLAPLQDDTARFNALPSVEQVQTSDISELQTVPEKTPLQTQSDPTPKSAQGISQGVILGLQAWGPKNAAAIAKAIDDAGRADDWLTIPEIAALPTCAALGLTTDQLYAFAEKPGVWQLMGIFSIEASNPQTELMGNFYSIETKDSMEKKPTNSRGRPAGAYFRLKSNAELAAIIRREARQAIPALTAQYDGKALPLEWTPEQIAELPGAVADPTTAEALQLATTSAKAADDDFADDLRLHGKRAAELWAYLERELDNEDPASLYPIDPDLLGKGSAHNVMAAAAHRYYHDREPNRTGDTWLFAALCGVSRPTLKKVREIARLKYAADTHETIELAPDSPDAIAREINRIARNRGGRALYISTAGYKPVPVRRENLPGVIACAARNDAKLRIELSVSQPLERYTPTAEQLAAEKVQRETNLQRVSLIDEEPTERKPRQPKQERRDIYLQSFRRIPQALGWTFDGTAWMHPDAGGELYPDHVPTLLKAITGLDVPGAGGPLVEVQQTFAEPKPAPVFPNWEDRQPADWWVNFSVLRERSLFDRIGA